MLEAARLVAVLERDPSTMTFAALQEWSHPASRELTAIADLFDRVGWVAGDKGRNSYPRPWDRDKNKQQMGNAGGRTPQQVMDILARFGHSKGGARG